MCMFALVDGELTVDPYMADALWILLWLCICRLVLNRIGIEYNQISCKTRHN